jgi:hypothetical protein
MESGMKINSKIVDKHCFQEKKLMKSRASIEILNNDEKSRPVLYRFLPSGKD